MPSLKKENIYSDNQSKISTHEKGVFGEDKACSFLLSKGYEIIERNFRVRNGEIDIIALKGEYLVFVEVKSFLDGDIDTLAQELNEKKQKKISLGNNATSYNLLFKVLFRSLTDEDLKG